MALCECTVYKDVVKSENIEHGRIEYIDTSKASDFVKEQCKNIYLLYYDTICIAVYNQNPKDNFKTIEEFILMYQTDTTRLTGFVKLDESMRLTISRVCKNKNHKHHYGEYVDWRDIEYSSLTNPFIKTKDTLITARCNWTE